MKPGLGCPGGYADHLRNLGNRQAEVVVEDDDSSLLWLQAPEATFELVTVRQRGSRVRAGWLGPEHPDLGRPAATPAADVGARVHEQPIQPCIKPLWVADRGQLPPGVHKGFLDGVLGAIRITEHESRNGVEAIDRRDREGLEGLVIAGSSRLDEVASHALLPFKRADWATGLTQYDGLC